MPPPLKSILDPRQSGRITCTGSSLGSLEGLGQSSHLDIPRSDVVLVPLERHVSVLLRYEPHQRLAVASTLRGQTEGYSTPVKEKVKGRYLIIHNKYLVSAQRKYDLHFEICRYLLQIVEQQIGKISTTEETSPWNTSKNT